MEENKDNSKTEENKINEDNKQQVTSTIKKTKPKDPGRVAAGKKLVEHNKKVREAKLKKTDVKEENKIEKTENEEKTSPLSINQMISIVGIIVSIAGLYYKRKEIMKVLNKKDSEVLPSETETETKKKYVVKSMD